jgi:hypothetical protein
LKDLPLGKKTIGKSGESLPSVNLAEQLLKLVYKVDNRRRLGQETQAMIR